MATYVTCPRDMILAPILGGKNYGSRYCRIRIRPPFFKIQWFRSPPPSFFLKFANKDTKAYRTLLKTVNERISVRPSAYLPYFRWNARPEPAIDSRYFIAGCTWRHWLPGTHPASPGRPGSRREQASGRLPSLPRESLLYQSPDAVPASLRQGEYSCS